MKLPIKSIAAFAASPQGRRMIKQARDRFDTPENRERLTAALDRAKAAGGGAGRPADRGRSGPRGGGRSAARGRKT